MNFPTQGSRTVFLFLLLCAMNPAIAELYRCPQPDGTPLFSDVPCIDSGGEAVELLENTALDSSSIGLYAGSRQRVSHPAGSGQVVFIEDEETSLRNARITARERAAEKRRLKRKTKRAKQNKNNGKRWESHADVLSGISRG